MDLIEAAEQGNITAVRDALEKGADVNAKDNKGHIKGVTALMNASSKRPNYGENRQGIRRFN